MLGMEKEMQCRKGEVDDQRNVDIATGKSKIEVEVVRRCRLRVHSEKGTQGSGG